MAVEEATTSESSNLRGALSGSTLRPGQVVVMDHLGAHRPKSVRELIEGRGCELVYLPPYPPTSTQ
jgi:transposase